MEQQLAQEYKYAFLDEGSKREIRRTTLKAIAIPGYQVPFASRELPIGRGWGTGGLQLALSLIGEGDCVKVIDRGHDDSVNAVSIKQLIENCSDVSSTNASEEATIIQTRHRIPEVPLRDNQILVLQVPMPEPLRRVEARETETKRLHAEMDYSSMWLRLYEDIVRWVKITIGSDFHSFYSDTQSTIGSYTTNQVEFQKLLECKANMYVSEKGEAMSGKDKE